MRLINAEKLKEEVDDYIRCNPAVPGLFDLMKIIIDQAPTVEPEPYFEKAEKDKRIYERGFEDGQNARPQGEWVSVSERLPDLFEVVLVTDEYGKVFEYERRPVGDDENVCKEWSFLGRNIIAWMPLPEPYKKGSAEE